MGKYFKSPWLEVIVMVTVLEAGFTLGIIPEGEVGLSIGVMKDGKMLRKSILVNITKNK